MPDHFHLLFTLGESGQFSDALRLFKGHRANLIAADCTWPWYFCTPDD